MPTLLLQDEDVHRTGNAAHMARGSTTSVGFLSADRFLRFNPAPEGAVSFASSEIPFPVKVIISSAVERSAFSGQEMPSDVSFKKGRFPT